MPVVEILAANEWLLCSAAFVFGLVVGSFLNVVILRLPAQLKYEWEKECAEYHEQTFEQSKPPGLVVKSSHCPKCKNNLKFWHNIPVISFLMLRGRCAFCQDKISWRYPLIEFLTAALSLLLALHFGWGWQLLASLILLYFLVVITWIDVDTFLIPDQLSLFVLWLGLFCSLFDLFVTPQEAIVGALVGYLSLWSLFWLFKLATGKEGMGYGDFKLLAAGGAWLGATPLIVVLVLASVTGLVVALLEKFLGAGEGKIPFGPYLSAGIFMALLWHEPLLKMYLG